LCCREADETIIKLTGIFEMVDKLRAEFEGRQRPLWDTEDHGPKIVERSLSFVQDTLVHSSTASSQQLEESELPMVSRDTNPSAEHGEDGGAVLAAREVITTGPPEKTQQEYHSRRMVGVCKVDEGSHQNMKSSNQS
jgi:hypothetical protein